MPGVEDGEPTTVGRADARDAASFARFYDIQWRPMVQLAYLTLGSREQAEDVVQEAFAKVHQRWSRVDHPTGYVRATVLNACRDLQRRSIRFRRREPLLVTAPRTDDAPDELWDALARLSVRQREALVLRYYAGLTEADIAEALGVRPGTVKSLVSRGLDQLRKEIEP